MDKCILLIRVSTQHQDLSQQTEKVKEEALKDGYNENNIIILEDKESAVKLSEEERNGLNQLKWHITHDNIKCVYAYEISRISRQPSILYSIRDFLISHNVQLIILNPYMKMLKDDGTLSETANIFFGIFSSMAENEGYIRKARLRRGVEKKKAQGLYVGSPVAIGYKVENDRYVIDEENAAIVRRIFNDYASGISIRQLARALQMEGWRTSTSFLTVCQSLLNILHREYYCGDKSHPQIISRELFNKCKETAKHKTNYRKQGNEALLKGLIHDMETGYLMSGNMANASRQYYCKRYGKTTISMKAADTLISGLANEWYNIISTTKVNEMKDTITQEISRLKKIITQQEKNIIDNQDKIDRIEERYIEGKISKERANILEQKVFEDLLNFRNIINDSNDRIVQLQNELEQTKPNIHSMRDKIKYVIGRIDVKRLSRFVCEVKVVNKWTGEQRVYEYNTKTCEIKKMTVITRPTLMPPNNI